MHIGSKEPEYVETIKLQKDESIQAMSVSYSKNGIHTLTIKTNKGNELIAESGADDEGDLQLDVDFKEDKKSIVGFRSGFNDYLEYLWVYTAQAQDPSTKENMVTSDVVKIQNKIAPKINLNKATKFTN